MLKDAIKKSEERSYQNEKIIRNIRNRQEELARGLLYPLAKKIILETEDNLLITNKGGLLDPSKKDFLSPYYRLTDFGYAYCFYLLEEHGFYLQLDIVNKSQVDLNLYYRDQPIARLSKIIYKENDEIEIMNLDSLDKTLMETYALDLDLNDIRNPSLNKGLKRILRDFQALSSEKALKRNTEKAWQSLERQLLPIYQEKRCNLFFKNLKENIDVTIQTAIRNLFL